MRTLILNSSDVRKLSEETWQLISSVKNCQRSSDKELWEELCLVLSEILSVCRKYDRTSPKFRATQGYENYVLYIASFLRRVATSEEWIAPHINKRAQDILGLVI